MGIGQEVLDVPFGEMVTQVALSVAVSQAALDQSSIAVMRAMGDAKANPVSLPIIDAKGNEAELSTSMIGAGFQPTFYQFSDAIIEVKMAISASREIERKREAKVDYGPKTTTTLDLSSGRISINTTKINAATMNASYTNKYNFTESASSMLRVRMVPLPPNPTMQKFMDIRARHQELEFELRVKEAEIALEEKRAELELRMAKLEAEKAEKARLNAPAWSGEGEGAGDA